MSKIKITKESEEVTYRRSESTVTLDVNGKKIRVYLHEDYDEMQGTDYDFEQEDLKALTEDERETLEDQIIWDLVRMEDGDIVEA